MIKVIVRRNKDTNEIITDYDEYAWMLKGGLTEAEIQAIVERYNESNTRADKAEIVELDDVSEYFYNKKTMERKQAAEKLQNMAEDVSCLARRIEDFLDALNKEMECKK